MRKLIFIVALFLVSCTSNPSSEKINMSLGLPIVYVTINGVSVEMILDTGGSITVIEESYLPKLKIEKVSGGRDIAGYGGNKNVRMTDQKYIHIANSKMYADVYTGDLSNIVSESTVVGILGIGHLTSVDAIIDLQTNQITVR